MKALLITIDGPAGAGKTTVSRSLAAQLGYAYIDTGALYRGVAYEMAANGVDINDEQALEALLDRLDLRFERKGDDLRLISARTDITDLIRTPEITMLASDASARPVVRNALFDLQRRLGAEKSAVFEGRDMGTVVFPEADIKFFLTADLHERARRRYQELSGTGCPSIAEIKQQMQQRDANDSGRAIAPLRPASDAVFVDSTARTVQEVVDEMLAVIADVQGR